MILSTTELQDNIQKEINTLYGTGATTEIPHKPNKMQLLQEYFKLCGNIVRMRHEIKSAKDNVARAKREICETCVTEWKICTPAKCLILVAQMMQKHFAVHIFHGIKNAPGAHRAITKLRIQNTLMRNTHLGTQSPHITTPVHSADKFANKYFHETGYSL